MKIPTEPIGSIPRPVELIQAVARGDANDPALGTRYEEAIRDTEERFEGTGSPVITDGEQRKYHNFWTYPVHGLPNTAPDGFKIPFAAGHTRWMPRLTARPFRYRVYANSCLDVALAAQTAAEERKQLLESEHIARTEAERASAKPVDPSGLIATVASILGEQTTPAPNNRTKSRGLSHNS